MIAEGRKLAKIADNIAIKVPLTWAGLKACKVLTDEGRMVNVTLCFSANQALLAAKAGATFISPFIGRLDDINIDGMELIADIRLIYDNYGFETNILAASIRSANHMSEAAKLGADVATAPPNVIKAMASHPLTDKGLEAFLKTGRRPDRRSSEPRFASPASPWTRAVRLERPATALSAGRVTGPGGSGRADAVRSLCRGPAWVQWRGDGPRGRPVTNDGQRRARDHHAAAGCRDRRRDATAGRRDGRHRHVTTAPPWPPLCPPAPTKRWTDSAARRAQRRQNPRPGGKRLASRLRQ